MFNERLKSLRKKAGLTQKNIADNFNIKQPTYAQWEQGKRQPSKETLEKFASYFNVSTDYLLGKTDNPSPVSEIDIDTAIDNSVAYDGSPITDNDRKIIKNFLKDYFANKEDE